MLPIRGAALVLALLAPAAALAQADRTGTGGGPLSTQTAPNTRSTGVTAPPGRGAAPRERGFRPGPDDRRMDAVDGSICDGCGVRR